MLSANDALPEGAAGRTFQLDQKKKKTWMRPSSAVITV